MNSAIPRISEKAAAYREAVRHICAVHGKSIRAGTVRYQDDLVRVERQLHGGDGTVVESVYRVRPGMDEVVFQTGGASVPILNHDPDIAAHLLGLVAGGVEDE